MAPPIPAPQQQQRRFRGRFLSELRANSSVRISWDAAHRVAFRRFLASNTVCLPELAAATTTSAGAIALVLGGSSAPSSTSSPHSTSRSQFRLEEPLRALAAGSLGFDPALYAPIDWAVVRSRIISALRYELRTAIKSGRLVEIWDECAGARVPVYRSGDQWWYDESVADDGDGDTQQVQNEIETNGDGANDTSSQRQGQQQGQEQEVKTVRDNLVPAGHGGGRGRERGYSHGHQIDGSSIGTGINIDMQNTPPPSAPAAASDHHHLPSSTDNIQLQPTSSECHEGPVRQHHQSAQVTMMTEKEEEEEEEEVGTYITVVDASGECEPGPPVSTPERLANPATRSPFPLPAVPQHLHSLSMPSTTETSSLQPLPPKRLLPTTPERRYHQQAGPSLLPTPPPTGSRKRAIGWASTTWACEDPSRLPQLQPQQPLSLPYDFHRAGSLLPPSHHPPARAAVEKWSRAVATAEATTEPPAVTSGRPLRRSVARSKTAPHVEREFRYRASRASDLPSLSRHEVPPPSPSSPSLLLDQLAAQSRRASTLLEKLLDARQQTHRRRFYDVLAICDAVVAPASSATNAVLDRGGIDTENKATPGLAVDDNTSNSIHDLAFLLPGREDTERLLHSSSLGQWAEGDDDDEEGEAVWAALGELGAVVDEVMVELMGQVCGPRGGAEHGDGGDDISAVSELLLLGGRSMGWSGTGGVACLFLSEERRALL